MGERHKCKLCPRTFANGRALGGHMKHHFSTLPLPPKPQPPSSGHTTDDSASFSSSEEEEFRESEEKSLIYGLRENPKKSFRLADPVFSLPADTGSVVQDRESESESKNPTRKRSKRNRKSNFEAKKPKLSLMESPVSSVSETFWPDEEDVAMCLMMLSRDRWSKSNNVVEEQPMKGLDLEEMKLEKSVRGKYKCDKCGKTFRSSRALGSHKSICCSSRDDNKIFECPFCCKVFGSGQALGGHKRSHLIQSSSSTVINSTTRFKDTFIDLNLPAPIEEEEDLGVVSDAY